ncbi:glyoxylate dehydrogenase [Mrakia frigida]|uniref:FMN-dependent alpha-hydroxy acid dehydrogenase n=1 Tax=Mrakia frigida TaxID=29902 RepID=UPI003FCC18A4
MSSSPITLEELSKHATKESCWIVVHGKTYDVTDFLDEHPGGSKIILRYAGKDATEAYSEVHPPNIVTEHLTPAQQLGPITLPASTSSSSLAAAPAPPAELSPEQLDRLVLLSRRPPIDNILSLHDFEAVATEMLSRSAYAYYASAADDEITMRENHLAYARVFFRPRILIDVSTVDFSTTILGQPSSLPIYITATALGKLGHPDGELNLTRGAGKHGVIQMIPTLASCSFDEMIDAALEGQTQFLQLYVNKDREKTKSIVQHAEKRGIKGLFITVDAPQLGRREKDMRQKFDDTTDGSAVQTKGGDKVEKNQGAARAISSFIDPGLSWKDLDFFKSITNMPIVLKGVQCWEDAVLAAEAGVAGVVLSNHGGRQLDGSRSGLEVLVEVVRELKARKLFPNPKFEIYIDGGVRRATDVIKAVALGATAVGIGRPFIYAYSSYGQEGVEHACQILKDEFTMNMRLIGARTIKEIVPAMVDASALSHHSASVPSDRLFEANYASLEPTRLRAKL